MTQSETVGLGGMTPATFLARHWQKKPLFVRQAIPGWSGLLGAAGGVGGAGGALGGARALFELAREPGAVARVVRESKPGRYTLAEAADVDERGLRGKWSVLLQGAEGFVDGGWELLRRFSFLPQARVDDLMISYASDGGGVGAHEDRYDVFLLQGPGRRRWQIQEGGARVFDESQPVKILKSFAPTDEWILEPGDMLYLPPGVAHCGTAVGAAGCFTYSIGFLAPSHESLVQNWLAYLSQTIESRAHDALARELYADPAALTPARDPMELPDAMVSYVDALIARTTREHGDVAEFLGRLLTGPKPNVVFHEAPKRPLSRASFAKQLTAGRGALALSKKSRGLVRDDRVFLNGEALRVPAQNQRTLLASLLWDRRVSLPIDVTDDVIAWLYAAYRAGGVVLSP